MQKKKVGQRDKNYAILSFKFHRQSGNKHNTLTKSSYLRYDALHCKNY